MRHADKHNPFYFGIRVEQKRTPKNALRRRPLHKAIRFAPDRRAPDRGIKSRRLHSGNKPTHAVADQHAPAAHRLNPFRPLHFLPQSQGGVRHRIPRRIPKHPRLVPAAQDGIGLDLIDRVHPHLRGGNQPVNKDHRDARGGIGGHPVKPGLPEIPVHPQSAHQPGPELVHRRTADKRSREVRRQRAIPPVHPEAVAPNRVGQRQRRLVPAKGERGGHRSSETALGSKRFAPGRISNADKAPAHAVDLVWLPDTPFVHLRRRLERGKILGSPETGLCPRLEPQTPRHAAIPGQGHGLVPETPPVRGAQKRRQFRRRLVVNRTGA